MDDTARQVTDLQQRNTDLVMKSPERLQYEIGVWADKRFGRDLKGRANKLLEESGELFGLIRADNLNIPDVDRRISQHVKSEIGDVLIVLMHVAHIYGVDAVECAREKLPLAQLKHGTEQAA